MAKMIKNCAICDVSFNLHSVEKRQAGGLANHCPDCAEETAIKHLGVGDGTGKQTSVQVLSFDSKKERAGFQNYWAAATGMHNGKACHMAYLPSPRKHKFTKIAEHGGNPNHKGKL